MLIGGVIALFTGKVPEFLVPGFLSGYTFEGPIVRVIGVILMAPIPAVLFSEVYLIVFGGSNAQTRAVAFELAGALEYCVIGVCIIVATALAYFIRIPKVAS